MGCDIHSFAERKIKDKWVKVTRPIFLEKTEPFGWRSYDLFGFLADVRNLSNIKPIGAIEGLPNDSEFLNDLYDKSDNAEQYYGKNYTNKRDIIDNDNYHSFYHLTLKTLLDYDYTQTFQDVRGKLDDRNYRYTDKLDIPKDIEFISVQDFLGEGFFKDIETLKTLGNPEDVRIIMYFDS